MFVCGSLFGCTVDEVELEDYRWVLWCVRWAAVSWAVSSQLAEKEAGKLRVLFFRRIVGEKARSIFFIFLYSPPTPSLTLIVVTRFIQGRRVEDKSMNISCR